MNLTTIHGINKRTALNKDGSVVPRAEILPFALHKMGIERPGEELHFGKKYASSLQNLASIFLDNPL